ncbi:MAG: RodZ domain-containing protein [Betaproteobacteria bacterium]
MTEGTDALQHDASPDEAANAGMLLRAGREAAGLSVAAVAQQLKLAPRQISALEEGDFAKLPGRTFIRGFVRNYTRLLHLDTDAVLAALPETAPPSSLESPSLAPTPRPMGELPADVHAKPPSAARWAIPLALVAVVTVAAVYEITRPPVEPAKSPVIERIGVSPTQSQSATPSQAAIPQTALAPGAPFAGSSPSVSEPTATTSPNTTTPLPNPLAVTEEKTAPAMEKPLDQATQNIARAPLVGEASGATSSTVDPRDAPIALAFQGRSWVEVRDGAGVLILSVTGNAGERQAVTGRPPFDVVIGNAAAVTVNWQGKAFDTTPYNRQNVARFTLR